jgi:serine/threonine-protein phosphatase 2A regulatory subunit B
MEELSEVITYAAFHPVNGNIFVYCTSRGTIRLNDTRVNALCDNASKGFSVFILVFEIEEDQANKSFFSEIISSISGFGFSSDGMSMLTRDYLTMKLWDVRMESQPTKIINIHDHLKGKLCDLYENDCIFDKFECHFSGNNS